MTIAGVKGDGRIIGILSRFVDDRQFETVTEEDEEDAEEEEEGDDGEFIPSSWNSNAKPSRSAMKSPDKSSSVIIYR